MRKRIILIKAVVLGLMTLNFSGLSDRKTSSPNSYIPGIDFLNISIELASSESSSSHECDGSGPGQGMGKDA